MKPPDLLNNVPAPVRILFRPMLLISLVLHGVLLILPIPSDSEKRDPPEVQVKVTQLPARESSGQSSVSNSPVRPSPKPTPTPQVSSTPSQSTYPPFNQPFTNPTFYFPQSPSNPRVQSEVSQPDTKKSASSTSQASQSPTSNATGSDTGEGTDTDDTNVKDPLEEFLENFPFPEGAEVGSFGLLSEDPDASARNVKQPIGWVFKYYGKELSDRKYTLSSPIADDADLKIYQVSQGDVSRYLHLIHQEEVTVILLSDKKVKREDLVNLDVETAEEREIKDTLQRIVALAAAKELTPYIKDKLKDEEYNDFGIVLGKSPEELASEISGKLIDNKIDIDKVYDLEADGLIYMVKKNDFKGFIKLIPTEDRSGTALVITF